MTYIIYRKCVSIVEAKSIRGQDINIFFSITALLLPLGDADLANQEVGSSFSWHPPLPPIRDFPFTPRKNSFLHLTAARDGRPVELSLSPQRYAVGFTAIFLQFSRFSFYNLAALIYCN